MDRESMRIKTSTKRANRFLRLSTSLVLTSQVLLACQDRPELGQKLSSLPKSSWEDRLRVAMLEAAQLFQDSQLTGVQSANFNLLTLNESTTPPSQSCQERERKVLIEAQFARSRQFNYQTANRDRNQNLEVKANMLREYSHPDKDLECDRREPVIEIDLNRHLVGLQLTVQYSREEQLTTTDLVRSSSPSSETTSTEASPPTSSTQGQKQQKSSLLEGKRTVTWMDVSKGNNGQRFHTKAVKGEAKRLESQQDAWSEAIKEAFTTKSELQFVDLYLKDRDCFGTDDDLAIAQGPIEREITQGTITTVDEHSQRYQLSFTGLKMSFSEQSCRFLSGQVVAQYSTGEQAQPLKTIRYDAGLDKITVSSTTGEDDLATDFAFADELCQAMELSRE